MEGSQLPPIQEILVQQDVPATMRDGTVLMSNVYRPAAGGAYPVLLTRLPYGKDQPRDSLYFDPIRAARNDYIVVVQDTRGRFASEGNFVPFVHEPGDGYDTVEWAARLPGSNGRVGMWGLSYFGKTQWHAAVTQPPSLQSMVPGLTWGNHLNGAALRGGVREVGVTRYWAQAAIAPHELFRRYAGEQIRNKLPDLLGAVDELLSGGGYGAMRLSELSNPHDLVPFARDYLARGVDDEMWREINIDGEYDRVNVPTFHIGGWYDCFIGETIRQYGAMKERSKEAGMRPPRLLVGPWTHGGFTSTQGDLDFGMASSGGFINGRDNLTGMHLRWFDATLKGNDEALDGHSPVQLFVMGENRWRGYEEWPPPGAREEAWHLRTGGLLSRERPRNEPYDSYDYDPEDPVSTLGGATLLAPIHRSGALDQRGIEARPDVLFYTSELLNDNYTVLGPVHVNLFAASSAPDTDFVARLVDVYPDGRAIVVTDGIIRASARESYPARGVIEPRSPSPIKPGEVYEYCIDLWATGLAFLAGHRIRVEVASSSFPRWERNLNTGESSARAAVARQRIFHDTRRPSRITLTVLGG